MSCRVKFTDTAKSDLREIAFYIADSSGDKNIAIRFVRELKEKCKILEQFPESGSLPKDRILKSAGYRFLVHKDYLIFYFYNAEETTVYIMSVFHEKKDYMRVMKKFI